MTALRERGGVGSQAVGRAASTRQTRTASRLPAAADRGEGRTSPCRSWRRSFLAQSGMKADPASLSRWLIRNGLSFKKKPPGEPECDRPDVRRAREEWVAERQPKMRLEPQRLVFIDETGTTTKMTCARGARRQGRTSSLQGQPFGHWKTQTFVAGLRCGALTAPWVVDAPMDRAIFESYVRTQLAPTLHKKGRHRNQHLGQSARAQKLRRPTGHSRARRLAAVSAALQPRPQSHPKWPWPNSRRISAPGPRAPSTNSGKPSDKSATSSQTQNAKTTSRPQDMDSTECPML